MEDKQGKEILEQKEDWKDQYGREKERNTAIKTAGKLQQQKIQKLWKETEKKD